MEEDCNYENHLVYINDSFFQELSGILRLNNL